MILRFIFQNKTLAAKSILFALSFAPLFLNAQIIDNRTGKAFQDEMFFNQQFLWQNKIKSITGVVSIKRPNRPIETRPDMIIYHFNEVGLLRKLDKVTSVFQLVDSLTIEYKRNDLGEVNLREENNNRGVFTTQMNYDSEGRLIRLDYGKSENVSTEKGKIIEAAPIIINSESFTWSAADKGVVRKSHFNNYGLNYSNVTITKNEMNCIVSEVEELVMSGRATTKKYSYNEQGWIDKIDITDNLSGAPKSEKFYYDKLGNLLKVEYSTAGKLLREIEVLYTKTMLIEAFLDHDLQSNDIVISKFAYEFHL